MLIPTNRILKIPSGQLVFFPLVSLTTNFTIWAFIWAVVFVPNGKYM